MSIALVGKDEIDIREFVEHLDVKPPLVNVLRQAVREFLVRRLDDRSGYRFPRHAEWAAKFRRKYPPLRIVHDIGDAVRSMERTEGKPAVLRVVRAAAPQQEAKTDG